MHTDGTLREYLALLVNVWMVDLCPERHLRDTYLSCVLMQILNIFREWKSSSVYL